MIRLINTQAYVYSTSNPKIKFPSNKNTVQFIESGDIENRINNIQLKDNSNCFMQESQCTPNILQFFLLCLLNK